MGRIICIAGPTASGKTALAVELAKKMDGEVVSCDSMQVYRRMDIGTAKPTAQERQGILHHMIDVAEPWEDYSVSRYCNEAAPIVEDILSRGKTAIIAGGTGLYMDSLIRGNDFAPFPSTGVREGLEEEADRCGTEPLLCRLRQIDPEAAERLHLSDRKRIIRALEVYMETGETITAHNLRTRAKPPRFCPVWIGLDFESRAELYNRIDRRVDAMLEQGLLDEIRVLLSSGVPEKCTAMQAIGYKEFVAALKGECSAEAAAGLVRQSSRRYAKRQLTWFRRNEGMHWIVRRDDMQIQQILCKAERIIRGNDEDKAAERAVCK
jgi:tRNA dimethylallyltransferase